MRDDPPHRGGRIHHRLGPAPVDLVAQDPVLLHLLARGDGDLDEDGVVDVEVAVGDQLGEGAQPGVDALGVVEPVDPEQHRLGVAEVFADLRGSRLDVGALRELDVIVGGDRDREGLRGSRTVSAALRRDAGWSQAELAQRLQVSPSAIGMYEQNRREPSAATLVALSQVFGVSTDYLLTGKPLNPPDQQALSRSLLNCLDSAQSQNRRRSEALTRQELAALFAAMLLEP